MKRLLTALLILLSLNLSAQIITKDMIKPIAFRSGLMMLSGSFDATAEVLRINYSYFAKVHPNANEQFWNPQQSYKNKWKNGDYKQGEKFPLSSTALVFTTDAYHLFRMGRNVTMITSLVIPIGKRKNWKQYVVEGSIYHLSYTAGFNLMYNGVYKMP